jgi:hypothetical protein
MSLLDRLGSVPGLKRWSSVAVNQRNIRAIEKLYEVTPTGWLRLEPSYQGHGVATFTSNPGTISGQTTVRYAEDGSIREFGMAVGEIEAEGQVDGPDSLFVFVYGHPIPDNPGAIALGPNSNECVSVEVNGDGFALAPDQRSSVIVNAGNNTATFKPFRTIARFESPAAPYYWVAPLINFVVDFTRIAPSLNDHALRTRRTAPYAAPDGPLWYYHDVFYRGGNALIPFLCEGEPAFVEPLPDYEARRGRVEAGESVVTAVMVGRVAGNFDLADTDWFPADLVTMLGLSSGRSVAVPFVEIRGKSAELVARMHLRIGEAGQTSGTALIDEKFNGTTGPLLTSFLVSDVRDHIWFRVMLKHLLRAFTKGGSIEDQLSHLFRAVEGASAGLKLNRSRPIEVSDATRHEITHLLQALDTELEKIAHSAPPDRTRIAQVRSRLGEIAGNRPSFASQLTTLLESVGLPDAAWLSEFEFRERREVPGERPKKPRRWASVASTYRNQVFHSAYIDFEEFDVDNAFAFIPHLSDVLARVVFHLIGFIGEYKPPCGYEGWLVYERPSWAKPGRLSGRVFRYVQ